MKMYKLIGQDGKEYLSEQKGTLGGKSKQKIYGRLDCHSALSAMRRFLGSYEQHRVFSPTKKQHLPQDFAHAEIAYGANIKNTWKAQRNTKQNLGCEKF